MKKISNANFPTDANGCTYHVGTKEGQVANRILTVGDPARAKRIGTFLKDCQSYESKRGFLTITGKYNDVPVSIVAIGMGLSMMDMMVREVRAVTKGPLLIARFGSCGGIGKDTEVGMIAVASKGMIVSRNYDHFSAGTGDAYEVSKPFAAYEPLLQTKLAASGIATVIGANCTADSFYSSQGRVDVSFDDHNQDLLDRLAKQGVDTLEMESSMLLHLAECCTTQSKLVQDHRGPIYAAACAMIFANRKDGAFIDPETVDSLEFAAGKAALEALVSCEIP
ncbi:nucleoside phosphorylase domain-containing protein [Gorgonomyces haynaldii]|nr:nucleoside phosphorylase domain-containing protein [Gorgonomyces haynaldii]